MKTSAISLKNQLFAILAFKSEHTLNLLKNIIVYKYYRTRMLKVQFNVMLNAILLRNKSQHLVVFFWYLPLYISFINLFDLVI